MITRKCCCRPLAMSPTPLLWWLAGSWLKRASPPCRNSGGSTSWEPCAGRQSQGMCAASRRCTRSARRMILRSGCPMATTRTLGTVHSITQHATRDGQCARADTPAAATGQACKALGGAHQDCAVATGVPAEELQVCQVHDLTCTIL